MGGEDVNRRSYDFKENRNQLLQAVNEYGRIFADMGLTVCYHPHTGTPIQTEYEIRSLMESVNPKYVSFAPDVAQIQKGGADAVRIVKDYLELVKHIHLKDYDGIPVQYNAEGKEIDSSGFACYTPLGEGVVDIPAILALLEQSGVFNNLIMVELDGGKVTPISQEEAVRRNRDYLKQLGYQFNLQM
jgi:inosose dehydratase